MRRMALTTVGVLLLVSSLMPAVASGATQAQLRARLEELKSQSARAGQDYMKAHWALDATEAKLAKTNKKLAKTKKRLTAAKKQLNGRANSMYRREELELLTFLVGASSFEELVTRSDYLARIGKADAEAVAEVKKIKAELTEQRSELKKQRKSRAAEVSKLRSRKEKLQKRLSATEAEFRRVQRQLDNARSGGSLPRGVAGAAGPNGMVFPVRGSYYYSDTWGASRSGGRRRHQGTDIMARTGTPVVAAVAGTVTSKSGGLGGRTIWLRGKNGWTFYYAHLDRWIVRSGSVKAGQVIGTVGSTGNASASAPHLHLQMHWKGGAPTNPYPYLRRME